MAESKKTSGSSKEKKELADQLRLAAELLDGAEGQPAAAAPKKTAAKKSSGSSTGAKKPAAKKPAAKSTAGKSTATKKAAPKAEQPVEEAKEPVATEPPVEEPPKQEPAKTLKCVDCGIEYPEGSKFCTNCGKKLEPPKEEPPVVEEPPVKELKCPNCGTEYTEGTKFCMQCGNRLEQPEQPVAAAEEPVKEQAPVVHDEAPVKEAEPKQPKPKKERAAMGERVDAFAQKSSTVINKIKLPLFIVANVLLLLSSIFLIFGGFGLSYIDPETSLPNHFTCDVFTYLVESNVVKYYWAHSTAGAWANGGYALVGILMWVAFLLPLALIAKNVTLAIIKKNLEVHMLDAIITNAFLLPYLGIVNMYGANMTWAHVLSLIMSVVLLAYTVFVLLIENRNGAFPFFSLANMVLILLCMFLLTSNKVYSAKGWYAAYAASHSGGSGFAFIILLVALAALDLVLIMQVKKLPAKVEYLLQFIVPAVAGGCALIALISFGASKPDGLGMGGGFVFGVVLTLLFAAADVVFAAVPKLHKFIVKVTDRLPAAQATAEQAATAIPVAQSEQAAQETPAEQPQNEPVKEQSTAKCESCGTENAVGSKFCKKCGRKL